MRYAIKSTIHILILAVFTSIICLGSNYAHAGELLDGRTFNVQYSKYGEKGQPTDDMLIFKDGKFLSTGCEEYGFGSAIYESVTKDEAVLFESTTKSDKEGIIEWEGKVEGDSISGNFMWSKPGQEPIFYIYSGNLKK